MNFQLQDTSERSVAAGALRGSAWTAGGMALSSAAMFLTNATVIAVAAPAVFGDVAVATVFTMITSVVFRAGIDRMVVAEMHAAADNDDNQAVSREIGSSLVAASLMLGAIGALLVIFGPLAWLLDAALSTPMTPMERALVGSWLAADVSRLVSAEAHRSEKRFFLAALSGYGLRAPLFGVAIFIASLLVGDVERPLVLGCAGGASTAVLAVSVATLSRRYRWRDAKPLLTLRRTRRGNASMMVTTLAGAFIGGADVWMVGVSLDAAATARYSFAATTAGGLAILSTAVNGGLSPYIATAHAREELPLLQGLVLRYVRLSLGIVLACYVALLLLLEPLAVSLGGSAYHGITPVIAILAAGQVLSTAAGLSGHLLGLTRNYAAVATATAVVAAIALAGEAITGLVLGQLLLLAAMKAAAVGLLPVLNDQFSARLLGIRTHAFVKSPWRH